ncbi:putative RNA 2'-phosphotransferase [Paenibacillus sp. JGP012]|uniref:RNA 2'-phosphotransferase n=1 Tax=Paenibacillus sp. JGP012 TaxID=2735914 RepID=UPI0016155B4B|nr:RNA 2'-phosphotransferase [Paenibacillus sp. JGP012]MBB6020420.1 putative RNA 2'-phosphotransferase [Paenibacillus sp. JGP012]
MDYMKLSKELSYALRHAPWEYELELHEEGWVDISQLLIALHESPQWHDVTEKDLEQMIADSEKKRHEIHAGRIRALYGHSTPQKIIKSAAHPPELLYHGTPVRAVSSIMEHGLQPRQRQYVHLSADIETAHKVGQRRDGQPAILRVKAGLAAREGILFYHGNENIWLADVIPAHYIEQEQADS